MKILIHRPGDTFFYLPLYIAHEFGIFKRFLPDIQVEFAPILNGNFEGDFTAVTKIVENTSKSIIPIAIADPTSFLLVNSVKVGGTDKKNQIKVIGGLINKPPFWVIDHYYDNPLNKIEEFEEHFKDKTLIVPQKKYATIYAIGEQISAIIHNSNNAENVEHCEFGKEFEKLEELQGQEGKNPNDFLVLSGDVVTIAEALVKDNTLRPQFCFANTKDDDGSSKEYAVTGILANKEDIEKEENKSIFVGFLTALQTAIVLIENCSSNELINVLSNASIDKVFSRPLSDDVHNKLFELIKDANCYSKSLNIEKSAWTNTLNNLRSVSAARYESKKTYLDGSFDAHTDFRFLQYLELNVIEDLKSKVICKDKGCNKDIELEKLRTEKTELEQQVGEKDSELKKLRTEKIELSAGLENLKTKNSTLENQVKELEKSRWVRTFFKSIVSFLKCYKVWILTFIVIVGVWILGIYKEESYFAIIGVSTTIIFGVAGFMYMKKRKSQDGS